MAITPIVHLNGTSAQELIDQQRAVLDAADTMLKALHAATPHGRDFYNKPGPENWAELARRAHAERIKAVHQIMEDALTIAMSVQEQAGL